MQESILHYIWEFQYFQKDDLLTTTGEQLVILHPGVRNTHAGPDFSNARIKIDNIEWIGSVEIHIKSSGWNAHKHFLDPSYENVVLHVVWADDEPVIRKDLSALPTLTLQHRVDHELLLRCNRLLQNPEAIPCADSFGRVRQLSKISMIERALSSRLESKALQVIELLQRNGNDWEETCYQLLCKNFGFKVNSDPFVLLAKSLPYKVIMKHADKRIQVESLLFGQAGLLEEPVNDDYINMLRREYRLLSQKFGLANQMLNKAQWRFLRLRPANFPTIRLAQLANLLSRQKNIFSKFIEIKDYADIVRLLSVKQSEYWQHHYLFGRHITEEIAALGRMSIDNIIVNTVVPILVAYGKAHDDQNFVDRAIAMLEFVGPEDNTIVKAWNALGMKSKNAFDTQGLLELHNNYCLRKRCLDCTIGTSLISSPVT